MTTIERLRRKGRDVFARVRYSGHGDVPPPVEVTEEEWWALAVYLDSLCRVRGRLVANGREVYAKVEKRPSPSRRLGARRSSRGTGREQVREPLTLSAAHSADE